MCNYGYHFTQWSDGNTENPRIIIVDSTKTYTAQFAANQYLVDAVSSDMTKGTVIGGGLYDYLSTAVISTIANHGYHFTQWNDGNTQNPRYLTVNNDTAFTAMFEINSYTATILSNDTTMGNVSGGGTYNYLTELTLIATPVYGYHFVQWSDGNSDNPRILSLTNDTTLTAQFAINIYHVTLFVNDSTLGTTSGSGDYEYLSQVVISAVPYEHYRFTQWSDGVTDNPRIVTVLENITYTAFFEAETYEITALSSDETMGTVTGGGTYAYGSSVELRANANNGYQFVCWNDGDSNSVRTIVVEGDAEYIATFAEEVSVETYQKVEVSVYPNPTSSILHISAEEIQKVEVYDLQGRMVLMSRNENTLNLRHLTNGLYTIRVVTAKGIGEKKVVKVR